MKRLLTLLALVLCSCAETFVGEEIARPNNENLSDLTAAFADEDNTRTYIEDGKYLRWHEDDRLTAFYGNTLNRQYKFNGATGDNSGTFSLVPSGELGTGNAFDHIYALYPYNADARITDEGVISLTLPAEQTYAENSFGRGANTMIAVTENLEDTFLAFKNACGYLKLKLYNAEGATIKSIEVKGNSGERLAGAATATIAFGEAPVLAMADDAITSVTLDCGEGVALGTTAETATELWMILPATTFTNGLTITATDVDGKVFEKTTTNEVVVERNAIQPMATLKAEFVVYTPNPDEQNTFITDVDDAYIVGFEGGEVVVAVTTNMEYKVVIPAEAKSWISVGETRAAVREETLTLIIAENEITEERSAIVTLKDKRDNILQDINITQSARLNTVANNEIWYTTTDNKKLFPNSTEPALFGAILVSNKYVDGKGVLTFDDEILLIGNSIFENITTLATITFPDSVTTIGDYAFRGCSSLTSITIPDSVTSIGVEAFDGCTGELVINCNIPSASSESSGAFHGSKFTSVTIGDSVTTIGDSAFEGCSSLASATIGNSVTTIGVSSFSGCSSLTSATIPDSVTTIGNSAFEFCSSLTSVYITDLSAWCRINFGSYDANPLYYAKNLYLNNELVTDLVIPSDIAEIKSYAFSGCSNLTSVTIPDSVTTIGDYAFEDCSSLTSVTIPDSVTMIGGGAFDDCSSLTSVTIPDSVTTIGGGAFRDCSSLTSVTIPDSVTTIGGSAFDGCESLTSVTIPDSVTEIGWYAFENCTSLTSVTIPDSVTEIGYYAFEGCSSLTSVTIGDSVTTIGEGAFADCSSLTSVTIPDSVTKIGYGAFLGCSSLTSVYCKAITPPAGRSSMFSYNASGRKIYVPMESVEAYKSASYWSSYADAIVSYDFEKGEVVTPEVTGGSYTVVLNNAWRQSTSVSNPDSSLYDGVYESYSNYNVNDGVATMYIDIEGYTEFSIYVRSNAESTYDYVTVSELDSTTQKMSTSGKQNSGTAISNYTKVTYTGIDGGKHRITVIYKKDYSEHSGTDRGYLIIPKNQ